ncbi:hypothetical protein SteCoe_23228 [Stentor coeruleus]|uniref:RING-type domain-containing protein n=1 Tax=Stentor coeruleus TaxID=5963 RepID=A0A1R2BKD1_9CILI|nr:hypothetical protein SteCoe_23228 [Stentor coeruleus]
MGKKFSKLISELKDANELFSCDSFFFATGFKLHFTFRGRAHLFRVNKNKIQVEQTLEEKNQKLIGEITPKDLRKAVCIAQHLVTISLAKTPKCSEYNVCCICFDSNIEVLLACGHGFCEKDIVDWKKKDNTCPMCRQSLCQQKMYESIELFKDDDEVKQSISELFTLFNR